MRKFITGAAAVALALAGAITGVRHIENAHAASAWYINPPPAQGGTGSDLNACTISAPCATLQHLIAGHKVVSGDTVHVTAGTYIAQSWSADQVHGWGEGFTGSTVPGTITYINVDFDSGAILKRAVIGGVVQDQGTPLLTITNTQGVIFNNVVAYGIKNQPGYDPTEEHPVVAEIHLFAGGCENVALGNATSYCGQYVTLQNPTVEYAGNSCIESGYIFSTIDGANLHDCGQSGNGLDHGIYLTEHDNTVSNSSISGAPGLGIAMHNSGTDGGTGQNLVIKNNTIDANWYGGISTTSGSADIENNSIHDNGGGIQEVGQGSSLTVKGNLFYNNVQNLRGSNAISFQHGDSVSGGGDGDGDAGPGNAIIENNTFYQNEARGNSLAIASTDTPPTGGTASPTIACNIFAGTPNYLATGNNSAETSSIDPKLFDGSLTGAIEDNLYWNAIQTDTTETDAEVDVNPRFVQEPINFVLDAGSQAIGACDPAGLGLPANVGAK